MMTISKTVALDRARRFPNKFGTLARTRTERTLPFERSDFANLSTRAFGTLSESRTHTFYPLKIVRLPIAPSEQFFSWMKHHWLEIKYARTKFTLINMLMSCINKVNQLLLSTVSI